MNLYKPAAFSGHSRTYMVNQDIWPGFYIGVPATTQRATRADVRGGGYWWQKFGMGPLFGTDLYDSNLIVCEDLEDQTQPEAANILFYVQIKETDYAFYTQGFQSWTPVDIGDLGQVVPPEYLPGDLHVRMSGLNGNIWRKVNKFPMPFGMRMAFADGSNLVWGWDAVYPAGNEGSGQFAPGGGTQIRYTPLKMKIAENVWHEVGPINSFFPTISTPETLKRRWTAHTTTNVYAPEAQSVCAWTVHESVDTISEPSESPDKDEVTSLQTAQQFPVGSYWYESDDGSARAVHHFYGLVDMLYVRWCLDHLYPQGTKAYLSVSVLYQMNYEGTRTQHSNGPHSYFTSEDMSPSSLGFRQLYMYRSSVPYTVDRARPKLTPSPVSPSGQGGLYIKTVTGRGMPDAGLMKSWQLSGSPNWSASDPETTWFLLNPETGSSLGFHFVTDQVEAGDLGSYPTEAQICAVVRNMYVVYRPPMELGTPPYLATYEDYMPTEILESGF